MCLNRGLTTFVFFLKTAALIYKIMFVINIFVVITNRFDLG
ncbi:MAG: hypothetical protein XD72_0632 [Methanothrix harundinacea]|jgi:hypothetical protein|uniref:Uncharacterized protein n=1 Tax=Methanothrix harundinacea TaxID=301375 RepID=A0A101IIF4_9EURY|nr:MAG: hypothetical protein XD72_0632 [Methanothrix harundinacea]KUK95807.1 MAG: hypothetical protein XE07_1590 [Methanothrix harundinacea]